MVQAGDEKLSQKKTIVMAQTQRQKKLYTVAEYLEFERQAEERHEFIDGEVRVMAGESPQHSILNFNLIAAVANQIKGKNCQGFSPNMKVRSGEQIAPHSSKGLFSYPDLTVVCGQPVFHDQIGDVLVNPKVIFEVLSPSTESFDRGEKFHRYRNHNESLTDYVLVWQTQPLIEHFQRQPNGQWLMTEVKGSESELHITSIDCQVRLAEVYEGVNFQSQTVHDAKVEQMDEEP
jgi:Uma2 family endonuclease